MGIQRNGNAFISILLLQPEEFAPYNNFTPASIHWEHKIKTLIEQTLSVAHNFVLEL